MRDLPFTLCADLGISRKSLVELHKKGLHLKKRSPFTILYALLNKPEFELLDFICDY